MSNKQTFHVFISSTGEDLKDYREAAIEECNRLGLVPIAMEFFEAMGKGATEGSKNKLDQADAYVGVFAHRYGYIEKGYDSSVTEIEFDHAGEKGLDRLCFLVDPEHPWLPTFIEHQNYTRLDEFKQRINKLIRAEFTTVEDFRLKIHHSLSEWLQEQRCEDNGADDAKRGDHVSSKELVPPAYRKRLLKQMAEVPTLGLDLKESINNGLPKIYVPAMSLAPNNEMNGDRQQNADCHELLLHRLGKESLYMPGQPGSGKSTFTQWVTYVIANGSVPVNAIEAPEGLYEQFPQCLSGRLPLLIRLRDFWPRMGCKAGQSDWTQRELEAAIGKWLDKFQPYGPEMNANTFERNLDRGKLVLIFDGVDEVPEEHPDSANIYPRHAFLSGLSAALPHWQNDDHRILLTSRPHGLSTEQKAGLRLPLAQLGELNQAQQELFVQRWYFTTDPARWQDYSTGLLRELGQRINIGQLDKLRRSPLLLTAFCVKYKEDKHLPHDIYHLYKAVVHRVLYNRYRENSADRDRAYWRLEAVALDMHYGRDDAVRRTPLRTLSYENLDRLLAQLAAANPLDESGADDARTRRRELLERTGLLLSRAANQAEFYHQDFRDFLAAERWQVEGPDLQVTLERFASNEDWRRMLVFLFARSIDDSRGIDQPLEALNALVEKCSKHGVEGDPSAALLLAECLEIAHGRVSARGAFRKVWQPVFKEICEDARDKLSSAHDRNELWLTLGRMGWDDRKGVGLDGEGLPDIEWLPVCIDQQADFYVARYPVTQVQFKAFIDATDGHADKRWWKGIDQFRREPSTPRWPEPNTPRTNVDWFEAVAFCRWLTDQGKMAAEGFVVSLPGDKQWRQAYVGATDVDFPWSGEVDENWHANISDSVGRTSSVGLFPQGRAKSRALDMAGNVWEWCLNEPDKLDNTPTKGNVDRVLRGGSWYNTPAILRSAYRNRDFPDFRDYLIGFRVVCRPPS